MAFALTRPLSLELTELISRLGLLVVAGSGMTEEEVRDLRSWLQAARSKHHDELREARGRQHNAEIVRPGFLPARYACEARPGDTEP